MAKNIVRGYYEESYPPIPTQATRYWRKNLIYQFVRFVVLNLKMIRIVAGGHS